MTRRVLRYEVPANGRWHPLPVAGKLLHVWSRNADVVELWAIQDSERDSWDLPPREFRVFGTGHELDADAAVYAGSCAPSDPYSHCHAVASCFP